MSEQPIILNPEAVGDPNQTPIVQLPAGLAAFFERTSVNGYSDLLTANSALQRRAEAAEAREAALRKAVEGLADEWDLNDCPCECCREGLDAIALRAVLGLEQTHE